MKKLLTYDIDQVNEIRVLGRTSQKKIPITLFWTGSGLEIAITGSELWIEIEVAFATYEPWVNIILNGASVSRHMLTQGRYWICLFRNMSLDKVKHIKLIKEVQAMSDDAEHCMQIHRIRTDGEFKELQNHQVNIEFIGDSITSGEGGIGAKIEEDWVSMIFSAVQNYTYLVAEKLKAEYRVISQSGWGIISGWDNNPNMNIPSIYEYVCGLAKGSKNLLAGAMEKYEFNEWKADIVFINLGTNDGNAFIMPAWIDPITNQSYQLIGSHLKDKQVNDYGDKTDDELRFIQGCVNFLMTVRRNNTDAKIIWGYGMLGKTMIQLIKEALILYKKEYNDEQVYFLELPEILSNEIGARFHPGLKHHQRVAEVIVNFILQLT